jgi:cellulose synthase/poly-beta-1,6-N-acetylglucosamine synthase-like glycosyltransferase
MVISAYNEERSIKQKIENCLALNYPAEKLQFYVVSDCSDDQTDEIVREYEDRGVILVRQNERLGKTAGLNKVMTLIDSDLVVFSDANAMYDPEAVRFLVRHFVDPEIGYVVGHARYIDSSTSSAAQSENFYWNIEVMLKQWESNFSSVVGGDGAIYMIRPELYEPLEETDINDFVNPLQIIAAGYRGIFDSNAYCTEEAADDFEKEFGRKVRIVNRSFNGLLRVKQLLNPFRFPRFCWLVVSHKLLRWFSPFIFIAHFISSLALSASPYASVYGVVSLCLYILVTLLAFSGALKQRNFKLFFIPYYFLLMNIACASGVLSRFSGEKITTWSTIREQGSSRQAGALSTVIVSAIIFVPSIFTLMVPPEIETGIISVLILGLIFSLIYTYLGYPLLLLPSRLLFRHRHKIDETFRPTVTLLIAAYNEAGAINDKLKNSLELEYPSDKLNIVVVSDGSTDGTNTIVNAYTGSKIRLMAFSKNRGKVTALNDAIPTIDSELVVLSDANVMYQSDAILKMVRHFADPQIGAVSGKVVLLNNELSYAEAENQYYSIEHFIQSVEGETGSMIGADGAMYALRRELYPFPPEDTILDDFVISMSVVRRGYRLIHAKEALGFERNEQEIGGEFNRKVRIIAGGIQCLLRRQILPPATDLLSWFKLISHKVLRWICGPLLIVLLLVYAYAFLVRLDHAIIIDFCIGATLFSLILGLICMRFPNLKKIKILSLIHYLLVMHLASVKGCWRGLLGRQPVTWKRG